MKTTIPEKITISCDFCKYEFSKSDYLQEYKITIKGSSLDGGVPVGPAYRSGVYDACHACYYKVIEMLN